MKRKTVNLVFMGLLGLGVEVTVVHADNVYVCTGAVYEFDSSGNKSLFASGFSFPSYMAFDKGGDLFVADDGNNTIEEFSPSGTGSVFATASSGLSFPEGLAFDNSGNLFVVNAGNNTIEEFGSGGTGSVFATANSGLSEPGGLAFDSSGNLYVGNYNDTILKFDTNGVGSVFAASGVYNPFGLAFDNSGNLYVANYGVADILKITPSGATSIFSSTNLISEPIGLAFDSSGNLYVGNNGDADILKINPEGVASIFASGLGDARGIAIEVPEPSGLLLLGFGLSVLAFSRHRR